MCPMNFVIGSAAVTRSPRPKKHVIEQKIFFVIFTLGFGGGQFCLTFALRRCLGAEKVEKPGKPDFFGTPKPERKCSNIDKTNDKERS